METKYDRPIELCNPSNVSHIEMAGKTLQGRQRREWYVGLESNVQGRACNVVRFARGTTARVLVRWQDDGARGSVGMGKTQWVGLYEIEPDIS